MKFKEDTLHKTILTLPTCEEVLIFYILVCHYLKKKRICVLSIKFI